MRCPNCGAQNKEGAQWCDQCLTSFRRPVAIVAPSDAKETTTLRPQTLPPPLEGVSAESKGMWKCPVCETANPADTTRCSTCGTDLLEYFAQLDKKSQAEETAGGPKNPRVAMVLSVFPGAGHVYLGRVAEGVGRLVLGTWWFGTMLILYSVRPLRWIGTVYLMAGLFLVGVSIIDAYGVGEDQKRHQILNQKMIYYSSLGLLGILFIGSMITYIRIR